MKRGVVSLPCTFDIRASDNSLSIRNSLGRQDLNYFALYWDRLIVPANRNIYFGLGAEEEFISAGFLYRPSISGLSMANNLMIVKTYSQAQLKILETLRSNDKTTDWRSNNIGNDDGVSQGGKENRNLSFRIDLLSALPVPREDVNVQDILKFKEKLTSELEAFHSYLDDLYFHVIDSKDFSLSRSKAFNNLEKSISDINRAVDVKWRSPLRFDFTGFKEFNLSELMSGYKNATTILAAIEGVQGHWASAATAIAATIAEPVMSRVKIQAQNPLMKSDKKISYLAKAAKSGIIRGQN